MNEATEPRERPARHALWPGRSLQPSRADEPSLPLSSTGTRTDPVLVDAFISLLSPRRELAGRYGGSGLVDSGQDVASCPGKAQRVAVPCALYETSAEFVSRLVFLLGGERMVGRSTGHGVSAGVSTVLAFLAGALTDVFTEGWSWPVGVSLGVLLAGWVGWETRRAARVAAGRSVDEPGRHASAEYAVPGRSGTREPVVPQQLPAAVRYFAGREAELTVLGGLLEESTAEARHTVVISAIGGAAGVGKTDTGL